MRRGESKGIDVDAIVLSGAAEGADDTLVGVGIGA